MKIEKPDFYFKTKELKNTTIYSCWLICQIKSSNPKASAVLVKISPSFYYEKPKKITKVILATTPKNALYPKPTKFPIWVTMYKTLVSIIKNRPPKPDETEIIDKGIIFQDKDNTPS